MPRKKALPEWLPAWDALKLLCPHLLGYRGTKLLLGELLKDGEIVARAAETWDSKRSSFNDAWSHKDRIDYNSNIELTEADWGVSRFWDEDLSNWRWKKNRFVLTHSKNPTRRTFLIDVEFRGDQIADMLPSNRKGIGGRKINTEAWGKIGVALIQVGRDGYFGPAQKIDGKEHTDFANVTAFITDILARTNDAYDESHASELLTPVYRHFYPPTQRLSSRNNDAESF